MNFAVDVAKWAAKANATIVETQRAIIIELFNSVILDTPVLTGRLRGNWIISSDNPSLGTVDIEDPSGATTTRKVEDFVESIGLKNVNVFLSNNLPYAWRIEYEGFSKIKSPEGMVRKNFIRISNILSS